MPLSIFLKCSWRWIVTGGLSTADILTGHNRKRTGVTNNINGGSVLFKRPSKPWQHDSESAWTIAGPWNWSLNEFSHHSFFLFTPVKCETGLLTAHQALSCSICGSFSHSFNLCPKSALTNHLRETKATPSMTPVCYNFNENIFSFVNCKYIHAC